MGVSDSIADMLTRIRNAGMAGHDQVTVPASQLSLELIRIFKAEGFIQKYDMIDDKKQGMIRLNLKYGPDKEPVISGLKRISKPGRRVYVTRAQIPRVMGGMGVVILSTSQGIITDSEARRRGIGGEVVCQVW